MREVARLIRIVCLFVTLAIGSSLHAEIEFPPELKTQEEIRTFAQRIRLLVPEVITAPNYRIESPGAVGGVENRLKVEQDLIAVLKKNPEYMDLAAQRPALQTFSFRRISKSVIAGRGVSPQWTELLKQTENPAPLKELFERWPTASLNGFFSAWAGLLTKEDRAILRTRNVQEKWAQLKIRLSTQDLTELRKKFHAERFGIKTQDWTWRDLDQAVEEMIQVENQIAVLVQQLNPEAAARNEAWFNLKDLNEWYDFSEFGERIEKLLSGLKERLADTYGVPDASIVSEVTSRELILRELPPYLAIYRGCIGNDCSTTHSWPFPYAPTERNWWVEDRDGRHLAYVSGAITQVNGESCLYIRDISGFGITPEDIPLIINGFYAAREMYGAKLMTIMSQNFTGENHFPNLAAALSDYGAGKTQAVNQVFADAEIRKSVITPWAHSNSLDDPEGYHKTVRLIFPSDEELADLRIQSLPTQPTIRDPNKDASALWELLQIAVNSNDDSILKRSYERQVDWQTLISALRNESRLPVKEYYEAIEKQFESDKLPFSRNMMKKNEQLFQLGHMTAPDAFRGNNVRQSVRYLMDMIWRGIGLDKEITEVVQNNLQLLEENELFTRNLHGVFERRQPNDFLRIDLLFSAGFRFLHVDLTGAELEWIASVYSRPKLTHWAVNRILNSKPADLRGQDLHPHVAQNIAQLLSSEDENIRTEGAEMFYKIGGLVGASGFNLLQVVRAIDESKDPQIRVPLALAYLRDYGNREVSFRRVINVLAQDVRENLVPSEFRKEATEQVAVFENNVDDCNAALTPPPNRGGPRSPAHRVH